MEETVVIPKTDQDSSIFPCWIPQVDPEGRKLRPLVRCKCGERTGIGLHHIHPDGRVTASYYHSYPDRPGYGCGWHVFIQLQGWDGGEMVPNQRFQGILP